MIIILHYDWSIRLGENTSDQPLKQLAAMQHRIKEHRKQNGCLFEITLV